MLLRIITIGRAAFNERMRVSASDFEDLFSISQRILDVSANLNENEFTAKLAKKGKNCNFAVNADPVKA